MKMDMYKGRPLDELTRDELIAAFSEFGAFHQEIVASQQRHIRYLTEIVTEVHTPPLVLWLQRIFNKGTLQ